MIRLTTLLLSLSLLLSGCIEIPTLKFDEDPANIFDDAVGPGGDDASNVAPNLRKILETIHAGGAIDADALLDELKQEGAACAKDDDVYRCAYSRNVHYGIMTFFGFKLRKTHQFDIKVAWKSSVTALDGVTITADMTSIDKTIEK